MALTKEQIRKIADEVHVELGFPYTMFLERYTQRVEEECAPTWKPLENRCTNGELYLFRKIEGGIPFVAMYADVFGEFTNSAITKYNQSEFQYIEIPE